MLNLIMAMNIWISIFFLLIEQFEPVVCISVERVKGESIAHEPLIFPVVVIHHLTG